MATPININLSLKISKVNSVSAIKKFKERFDEIINFDTTNGKLTSLTTNDKNALTSSNIAEIYNSYDPDASGNNLDLDDLQIEVEFKKPIPITDTIKDALNESIMEYIGVYFNINPKKQSSILFTDQTLKNYHKLTIYREPLQMTTKKNRNTDPNLIYTKKIMWIYTIGINESVNKLIKCVKNNDIKNGNKILSNILKEKINAKLDKTLK